MLIDRLRVVSRGEPSLLVPLLNAREPPYELVLDAAHAPRSLAMARAQLASRLARTPGTDEALWRALARSGVIEFLQDKLSAGKADAAPAARALAHAAPDGQLARFALAQLENRRRDLDVRRNLARVVEDGADAGLLSALLKVLRREPDRQVSHTLFRAALRAGGSAVAVRTLELLPARRGYRREQVIRELVDPICALGAEAPAVGRQAIRSRSPLVRLTGVLILDRVGEAEDAALVKRLGRDRARLPGLAAGESLRLEAARVGAKLAATADPGAV